MEFSSEKNEETFLGGTDLGGRVVICSFVGQEGRARRQNPVSLLGPRRPLVCGSCDLVDSLSSASLSAPLIGGYSALI